MELPDIHLPRPRAASGQPPRRSPRRLVALGEEPRGPVPAAVSVLPPFGPGGEFSVGAEE